jgi:hypothetical protein
MIKELIDKPKKKDKEYLLREQLEKLSTEELYKKINSSEEILKISKKVINKRPDRKIGDYFGELFEDMIISGGAIFGIALIYFGAIAPYFNVNNEFINPTNSSFGLNKSMELAGTGFVKLMEVGSENPTFWFWFFWFVVYCSFINPILSILGELLKRKFKLGVNYLDIFELYGLIYLIRKKR